MKLSEHQLNEVELFEDAVKELTNVIEQLNACARNLDAAGIVADFAMPTPIKVVHYVFKSVPITRDDIQAAKDAHRGVSNTVPFEHAAWCKVRAGFGAGAECTCVLKNG